MKVLRNLVVLAALSPVAANTVATDTPDGTTPEDIAAAADRAGLFRACTALGFDYNVDAASCDPTAALAAMLSTLNDAMLQACFNQAERTDVIHSLGKAMDAIPTLELAGLLTTAVTDVTPLLSHSSVETAFENAGISKDLNTDLVAGSTARCDAGEGKDSGTANVGIAFAVTSMFVALL
jgi:hypothetical protein